ncbi:MAG: tyrosine-type recombinase/integrase [Sarcina sp.]
MTNLVEVFKETLSVEEASSLTVDKYVAVVNEMLEIVGKEALEISVMDLKLVWLKKLKESNANRTVNNKIAGIRKFFKMMKDYDIIESNPADKIELLKNDSEYQREIWTVEEIKEVISGCKDLRTKAVMEMLIHSGLRIDECISITMDEYQSGKFTQDGVEYVYMNLITKGNKKRDIYIKLENLYNVEKYIQEKRKECIEEENWLFVSNSKKKMKADNVNNSMKKAVKECGIDKEISAHLLRSAYTTNIIENHGLESACSIMNHSSINITAIYWNRNDNLNKDIMMSL